MSIGNHQQRPRSVSGTAASLPGTTTAQSASSQPADPTAVTPRQGIGPQVAQQSITDNTVVTDLAKGARNTPVTIRLSAAQVGDSLVPPESPLNEALKSILEAKGFDPETFRIESAGGSTSFQLMNPGIAAKAAMRVAPALAEAGHVGAAIDLVDAVCGMENVTLAATHSAMCAVIPALIEVGSPAVLNWVERCLKALSSRPLANGAFCAKATEALRQRRERDGDRPAQPASAAGGNGVPHQGGTVHAKTGSSPHDEPSVETVIASFKSGNDLDQFLDHAVDAMLRWKPRNNGRDRTFLEEVEKVCDDVHASSPCDIQLIKLLNLHRALAKVYADNGYWEKRAALQVKLGEREAPDVADVLKQLEEFGFCVRIVEGESLRFQANRPASLDEGAEFPGAHAIAKLLDGAPHLLHWWPAHVVREIFDYLVSRPLNDAQKAELFDLGIGVVDAYDEEGLLEEGIALLYQLQEKFPSSPDAPENLCVAKYGDTLLDFEPPILLTLPPVFVEDICDRLGARPLDAGQELKLFKLAFSVARANEAAGFVKHGMAVLHKMQSREALQSDGSKNVIVHCYADEIAALHSNPAITPEQARHESLKLIQRFWIQRSVPAIARFLRDAGAPKEMKMDAVKERLSDLFKVLGLLVEAIPGESTRLTPEEFDAALVPLNACFGLAENADGKSLKQMMLRYVATHGIKVRTHLRFERTSEHLLPEFMHFDEAMHLLLAASENGPCGAAALRKLREEVGFLKKPWSDEVGMYRDAVRSVGCMAIARDRDARCEALIDALPEMLVQLAEHDWPAVTLELIDLLKRQCAPHLLPRLARAVRETIELNAEKSSLRSLYWSMCESMPEAGQDEESEHRLHCEMLIETLPAVLGCLGRKEIDWALPAIARLKARCNDSQREAIERIVQDFKAHGDPTIVKWMAWREGDGVKEAIENNDVESVLQYLKKVRQAKPGQADVEAMLFVIENSPRLSLHDLVILVQEHDIMDHGLASGNGPALAHCIGAILKNQNAANTGWLNRNWILNPDLIEKVRHESDQVLLKLALAADRSPQYLLLAHTVIQGFIEQVGKPAYSIRQIYGQLALAATKFGRADIGKFYS